MGIMDFFKGQFIDVIRWENPEEYLLVKKFDRHWDEIKDDATLIVEPGYLAIFVHNGKIEAIQKEPGKWTIDTENIPFITTIKSWKRLGESTDKASVYFVKTIQILNQKWGTKNPVKYIDPKYSFPIKLRAFGNFTFMIDDIEKFWLNYIGTRQQVTVDEIRDILVDRFLQHITSVLANMGVSYIDIDSKRAEIAQKLYENVNNEIKELGLKITDFRIEDTNFDEETESLIKKISDQTANVKAMNQLKDVDEKAMANYQKTRQLDIMQEAASNEGAMGGMVGTMIGMNMANQISSTNISNDDIEQKLIKLKSMLDKGLITKEEYDNKKRQLLESL